MKSTVPLSVIVIQAKLAISRINKGKTSVVWKVDGSGNVAGLGSIPSWLDPQTPRLWPIWPSKRQDKIKSLIHLDLLNRWDGENGARQRVVPCWGNTAAHRAGQLPGSRVHWSDALFVNRTRYLSAMHGVAAIFLCPCLEMFALPLPMSPLGLVVAGLRSLRHGLRCWHPPGRLKLPACTDVGL